MQPPTVEADSAYRMIHTIHSVFTDPEAVTVELRTHSGDEEVSAAVTFRL